MPSFSRHDIDNFAFKAVDALEEGTPLQASVEKLASENSMNPEQIKRLVEATNTSAFLRSYKKQSGNQRMVEFEVADANKAINSSVNAGASGAPRISITISTSSEDGPTDLFEDIKDEYAPKVASVDYSLTKEAAVTEPAPKKARVSSYMQHKYKDSLLTKLASCNYSAEENAEEIANNFKGIYSKSKYASFELDSLSKFGNKALPALHMVRARLGMSKIARKLSDAEAFYLADRHVIDGSSAPLLDKVATIVDLCEEHNSITKGLEHLKTAFKGE